MLNVGCGTGFHLARLADAARSVVGVEPHPPLVERARQRVSALPGGTPVRVVQGRRRGDRVDNGATRSTFGGWFRRSLPGYASEAVERFWTR